MCEFAGQKKFPKKKTFPVYKTTHIDACTHTHTHAHKLLNEKGMFLEGIFCDKMIGKCVNSGQVRQMNCKISPCEMCAVLFCEM